MKRLNQFILITTYVSFSWLAMQAVHEFGHIVGAWLTEGEVSKVALHPFIISRTELSYNPHPLIVVWAGPLIGSTIPLFFLLLARLYRFPGIYLFRFFAGFCLIANGAYIALGPSDGAADTGIMIHHGTPRWLMVTLGTMAVGYGLRLWHNQGEKFGLGEAKGEVSRQATIVSTVLLITLAGLEFMINR